MNQVDFAFIEKTVGVVLPDVFKNFLRRFPTDPRHRLVYRPWDNITIPTNAELFAIAQLRQFRTEPQFNYYQHQRKLLLRRFLNIGDEGNGDFYCMVGNDVNSDELWAWLHDSFATPLFIRCNDEESVRYREKLGLPLGTTLREYLSGEWVLVRQADPFTEMSDGSKTICRANHPLRGILNPIRLQEWRDYIARFSQFEFDEFVKATVLGKKRRLHLWPGRVKWNLGETWVHINYMHGCLTVSPDAAGSLTNVQLKTLRGFARDLNAKLL